MRLKSVVGAVSALVLVAACTPPAQEEQVADEAMLTFEDDGCLGYLLLQRAAIGERRAQGDVAALEAATTAWRAAAQGVLSAEELAQYEASSFAVQDDESAETIAARAAACVANAPH